MYKIYADDTLIYDSTLEDYKIGKGQITLETNKSGSFVFSVYPDHFYYDSFVRLKTVITVYKSGKIVFRGRILNDVTDYWNNKVITCEGELGFLQDSIIRPFTFTGTPEELFIAFITEHNAQVDEFKRFKIGVVTVENPNDYIGRSNSEYESALSNLNSRLIEDSLGGYFYITHGDDGTDIIPTINYLADFTKVSSQKIEFGSNLKNYTKTVKAEEIATAIIPLGAEVDDGNDETDNPKLTIESVNGGKDYVYSESGVALYGWIFKVVSWDDVTEASNLKRKAEEYLENITQQNITIELNAIDLHLLDPTIESFGVCDYVRVTSEPHNFDSTLLCNKQTLDLLKPENDSLTLGYTYSTFTEISNKVSSSVSSVVNIQSSVKSISNRLTILNETVSDTEQTADKAIEDLGIVSGDLEAIAGVVTENARNIATNATNIAKNAEDIEAINDSLENLEVGTSIKNIQQTTKSEEDNGVNVVTITLSDNTTRKFEIKNGSQGSQGPQGKQGEPGETGPQGVQGETGPQGPKGDTGATGPQGKTGEKGSDGVSCTHSWNGTILSVTSASGTTSTDLKGEKGDTGPQGNKGDKGDKGDTGATGANGTNGVSPTISVSKSGKVTTITIKDVNGTKTATINDGVDGASGTGVDYEEITDAEIQSIYAELYS